MSGPRVDRKVKWDGRRIRGKAHDAAVAAVNETMEACVEHARADHPPGPEPSLAFERWHNQTDELLESIRIFRPAGTEWMRNPDGSFAGPQTGVGGSWGADAPHALYLEIGTSLAGPTAFERERAASGDMHAIAPPFGPLMYPRASTGPGYLRPAADEEYPKLKERVRAHFLKGARG